jgi:hypothetical protein
MAEIAHISGLKELNAALAELPKATARNVLQRTLKKAAQAVARKHASTVLPA